MAKTLKSFEFRTNGPAPRYPWDEWSDGRIWQVTRGEDFDVPIASFRSMITQAARVRGKRARTSATGDVLTFQIVEK